MSGRRDIGREIIAIGARRGIFGEFIAEPRFFMSNPARPGYSRWSRAADDVSQLAFVRARQPAVGWASSSAIVFAAFPHYWASHGGGSLSYSVDFFAMDRRITFRGFPGRTFAAIIAVAALVTQLGCGQSPASVAGQVTFEGEAIPDGMIRFTPILLAVLYGYALYRFSAWRTARELDAKSTELADPLLRQLCDQMAQALEIPRIKVHIYEIEPVNGLAAPDGRIFITRGIF